MLEHVTKLLLKLFTCYFRFLASLYCRGLFQYGLLHFGHHVGSLSPFGGHSCPQRSHSQYQTIFLTLAIRGILARGDYMTASNIFSLNEYIISGNIHALRTTALAKTSPWRWWDILSPVTLRKSATFLIEHYRTNFLIDRQKSERYSAATPLLKCSGPTLCRNTKSTLDLNPLPRKDRDHDYA